MAVASFNMEDGFSILSRSEGVGPVNGGCRRALNITGHFLHPPLLSSPL